MSEPTREPRGGATPLRVTIWVVGGAIAIVLTATGIVGILTKAR